MNERINDNSSSLIMSKEEVVHELLRLGVSQTHAMYIALLCRSKQDIRHFFENDVLENTRAMIIRMTAWRNALLASRSFSVQDFIILYEEDKLAAIEELFLLPIAHKPYSLYLITQHLQKGDLDLQTLYDLQKQNPTLNPTLLIREYLQY